MTDPEYPVRPPEKPAQGDEPEIRPNIPKREIGAVAAPMSADDLRLQAYSLMLAARHKPTQDEAIIAICDDVGLQSELPPEVAEMLRGMWEFGHRHAWQQAMQGKANPYIMPDEAMQTVNEENQP